MSVRNEAKKFHILKKACLGNDNTKPTGKIAKGYEFTENGKNILRVINFKH